MASNQIANQSHAAAFLQLNGITSAPRVWPGSYGVVGVERIDVGEYVVELEQPLSAPAAVDEPAAGLPLVTIMAAPGGFTVQAGILPTGVNAQRVLVRVYDTLFALSDQDSVGVALYVQRLPQS